jgi:glutaredoxin
MSIEELVDKLANKVDGENGTKENILIFTLSTCQWCKKCKRFLDERNVQYRYIDVDKIEAKDKSTIINHLKSTYETRISYPFLVCESGHVVGYNPNQYEEILRK